MPKFTFFLIALAALVAVDVCLAESCGQSSVAMRPNRVDDGGRIVGGVEAKPHSHPWIVSLQRQGRHFCGGTLIRVGSLEESDIVVTAAHCVAYGTSGLTVTAGAHDLSSPSSTQQTVGGARSDYHPQYNSGTTLNDIAIIKLEKPIGFTSAIQPICLPVPGKDVPENTEGTVAGWGVTREGGFKISNLLMQVGVPVISTKNCSSAYATRGIKIDRSAMLCAGYSRGGKDSCQGDSGGPFVTNGPNGYVLQGVVSFGIGCARPGLPGVYAKVVTYLPWINEEVKALSSVTG